GAGECAEASRPLLQGLMAAEPPSIRAARCPLPAARLRFTSLWRHGNRTLAPPSSALSRALDNRAVLGTLFMLPAGALLLVFLTYPLGLGTWLGFTDTKIGRGGEGVGHDNFHYP